MKKHPLVEFFATLGVVWWIIFFVYDWKIALLVMLVMWADNLSRKV